ncbi:MAG TPA: adenylate/guanylate cyclase domain-containing protein [Methylomirabilota bacterium]|nr:adenylate/guanylate cyclase domain-containing protein [Methylomirabilota bacterium]
MEQRPTERRLAAILSADVEGYSRLMSDDEAATVRTITEYRDVITGAVAHHGGRVVDALGDNVLAEFSSVVTAVECAVEVQRELRSRNAELPAPRQMRFRIGINLGDIIVDGTRVYGDGVNIAARLESLAEGGGICLSGTAYDQIEGKLPYAIDVLGEQTVKNIPRPVRVYRLHPETRGAGASATKRRSLRPRPRYAIAAVAVLALFAVGGWFGARLIGAPESAGLPLPAKPSVAVLPFANLSQDPSQDYFSDGVTEDLITGLSKVSGLFVIARNSAFTYKGRPAKISDVGRDLGVRYVVEGGVQRAGNRVRITAQLVDATTGYHIWAERYDREANDIFAVQDEVTRQIVRAMAVRLTETEQTRIGRAPTGVLEAYDLVLRGTDERRRTTRESNAESRRLLVKALDLDPEYAAAYTALGWAHLQSWQFLWSTDRQTLDRAGELAERAITLDPLYANAYHLLGQVMLWRKEHERALSQIARAIELAPNDADGFDTLAEIHGWSGTPEQGIRDVRHAMRLNPHYPFFYLWPLGHAYYLLQRRQEALDTFAKITDLNRNFLPAHAFRAVLLGELGRDKEAHEAWQKARELSPTVTLANLRERLPYRRPSDLERFLAGAHRAGMD